MDLAEKPIGRRFQQETKYVRPSSRRWMDPGESSPAPSEPVALPAPGMAPAIPFWEVLEKRRSLRDYSEKPISMQELGDLLWATQGVTASAPSPWFRTAPSAGALHPIDTYLVVNRVTGLDPGVYRLRMGDFSLDLKRKGDFSSQISQGALDQAIAREAAVVFVWVAVIERSRQKYRQRAYRYIYLDCGHIAQNLYLAATALNLGCCAMAAFYDDEVNALIGADGQEETAIYLAAVGNLHKNIPERPRKQ
jgi:SagB-type dehydrogenase family enzyme